MSNTINRVLNSILAFAEFESHREGLSVKEHLDLQTELVIAFEGKQAAAQDEWDAKQEGFA